MYIKKEEREAAKNANYYYKKRKDLILNAYKNGELSEMRACELLSFLSFVQKTKQKMPTSLITNDPNVDILCRLLRLNDIYIKENYIDILKTNTNDVERLCTVNAIRSLIATDYIPTREEVERMLRCGTKRSEYEKLFREFGQDPKDLYLSFYFGNYDPNYSIEDFKEDWIEKEVARYKRTGKFDEETARKEAELSWETLPKKQMVFREFANII